MTNNKHNSQREFHKWTGAILLTIWMIPAIFMFLTFIYERYVINQYNLKDRIALTFTDVRYTKEGREKLSHYNRISAIGSITCMSCSFIFVLTGIFKPRLLLKKGNWGIKEHIVFLIFSTIQSTLAFLHYLYY